MTIFFLTLGAIATLMVLMAVGVIFSNRVLRGSCGGVGQNCSCENAGRCDKKHAPQSDDIPVQIRSQSPSSSPAA